MKLNTRLLLTVTLLMLVFMTLAAGCASSKTLEGEARDRILASAEPMTDNLLAAIAANDQAAFIRDMDETMTTAFSGEQFGSLVEMVNTKAGTYQSREVKSVVVDQGFNIITYELVFDKASSVSMRLILTTSEPYKISGLWLDAPEFR